MIKNIYTGFDCQGDNRPQENKMSQKLKKLLVTVQPSTLIKVQTV